MNIEQASVLKTLVVILKTSPGATSGVVIDRQGFGTVTFVSATDDITGTAIPVVRESDLSGSGMADVPAAKLEGAFVTLADNQVQEVGYKGIKRYVTVNLPAGVSAGEVAILAILGHPDLAPA